MFSGSIPALVTPFANGSFDEASFRALVDWQVESGSSALVPCGTTGEAATMTIEEHDHVVRVCVDQAQGRVPVIAGCGSNDTAVALHHIHAAKAAGAAAALLVPPYYNRPNQEGVFRHFEVLARDGGLPIVLYNVPGRTITDIAVETVERIVKAFPDVVVGIKDATGQMPRVSEHRARCGPGFAQLSGNDDMTLAFMAMGGVGAISVTANVAPAMCAEFQDACAAGDFGRALTIQDRLYPLHAALFSDASPGPVKYALGCVRPGFPTDLRLPMTPPSAASRAAIDAALDHAGLVGQSVSA